MKNMFTEEERKILEQSPYIEKVNEASITYGEVFHKELSRLLKFGYDRKEALRYLGFPESLLESHSRIRSLVYENKKYIERNKHKFKYDSVSEELEALRAENIYLKQENEFIKKKDALVQNHLKKKN